MPKDNRKAHPAAAHSWQPKKKPEVRMRTG